MSRFVTVIAAALLLTACKGAEPAAVASEGAAASAPAGPAVAGPERRILAVGDSLFAGYGLDPGQGYPERLEAALRARGINARVSNAGVSGDTSAAGAQRFAFVLDAQSAKPDLVIIEFGGNDVLRGLPPAETRKNINAMLAEAKKRGLRTVLIGMLAPPNLGGGYRAEFEPIYPALAKKYGAALIPFFLDGVIDKRALVQADHHHPTAQGVEEIVRRTADTVSGALPPL